VSGNIIFTKSNTNFITKQKLWILCFLYWQSEGYCHKIKHKLTSYIDKFLLLIRRVRRWRSWLRHCATNRKVAGSILDGVTGIFHWHNPSGRDMAFGLTQSLTETNTRNISWEVKATGAWGSQPYHLRVQTVLKSGSLNLLEPSGPVQACNGIALPLPFTVKNCNDSSAKQWAELCPTN
jgi:hypothetical protein